MLNQCSFIGHLGQDPAVKEFQNGGRVCNLSIGVTEKWNAKDTGERKEKTTWVDIVINSDGLIKVANQYLRKGSKIFVQGKLNVRKYQDQSGNDKYRTEIVVSGFGGQLVMLDSANGGQSNNNQSSGQSGGWGSSNNAPSQFDDGLDDSVPF